MTPPCKSCDKRRAGCHAECEAYLSYYRQCEEIRKSKDKWFSARDFLMRGAIKTIKKNQRHR